MDVKQISVLQRMFNNRCECRHYTHTHTHTFRTLNDDARFHFSSFLSFPRHRERVVLLLIEQLTANRHELNRSSSRSIILYSSQLKKERKIFSPPV